MKLQEASTGEPIGYATVSLNIPLFQDVRSEADSLLAAGGVTGADETLQKTGGVTEAGGTLQKAGGVMGADETLQKTGGVTEEGTENPETDSETETFYEPYKYVFSDGLGVAEIGDVEAGTYVLKVELLGYNTIEQSVEVGNGMVDLGILIMSDDVEVLEAATIMDMAYPVIVKKDTVEYATAAYKTTENDTLEDLLKKLPGVEVDDDGNLTSNGEEITKITINGKSFFLDDPTMATKNLSAKIIEKVKIVEKKSDQAIFSGIDDGERETVIDLVIKPGMLECWSGNLQGGGGHDIPTSNKNGNGMGSGDWRFRGSATMKRFTDLSQLSLIANGNNLNNGTTTSWNAGLNGAYILCDGDMDLAGHYKYNGSHKRLETQSEKTTYLDDGSNLIYNSEGTSITNSQTHNIGARLEHAFSENTSIIFEPKFTFTNSDSNSYTDQTTFTDPGTGEESIWTNSGFTENVGWSNNWTANGYMLLRQRLGIPGRTFSVNLSYSFTGNKSGGYNQSLTETLAENSGIEEIGVTDEEIVNQRYTSSTNTYQLSTRATYTEPLADNFFLEVSCTYTWNTRTYDKDTYDSADNVMTVDGDGNSHLVYNSEGELWNGAYSNSIESTNNHFFAGANMKYQCDNWRLQLGAAFRPNLTDTETDGESYHSYVSHWSPQAMFSYDFNDNTNMRLTYSGAYSQVPLTQLMPVTDNANPLNVSFSNPYMEPYFSHNLRGTFSYTDKETFTSVRANWRGSLVQDKVTTASWYGSNGAQYSIPLNGTLSGDTNLLVTVNSPISNSDFSVSNTTNFRYSNSSAYTGKAEGNRGDELIDRYYDTESGVMDYELFHDDFFGSDATQDFNDYFTDSKTENLTFTERLRFTYRNDLVEVNLGERTVMSKSWCSLPSYNYSANWQNQIDASMNWTLPGGVGIVAEGRYKWYNGYVTPLDDEIVVNAEVSKMFLESKFTLSLKAYDIFNQTKSFSVTDASNYHNESRTNTFGRYVVLSLIYRFGENTQR